MEWYFAIVPCLVTVLICGVILLCTFCQAKREVARIGFFAKTKYPRQYTVRPAIAFIFCITLFAAGTAVLCIFKKDFPIEYWLAFIVLAVVITLISLFYLLSALRTYEVIRNDGILFVRLFTKKLIKFSEMAPYHYDCKKIILYDSNYKPIFSVDDSKRIGIESFVEQFERKGIFRE